MTNVDKRIIQAEFFHVGAEQGSLEGLLEACRERVIDGSPIKTAVRFYDEGGFVTEFVTEFAETDKRLTDTISQIAQAKGWFRMMLTYRQIRLSKKILAYDKQAITLIKEQLLAISETSWNIAIEELDRSFRPARRDEMHDLRQAAQQAKSVWVFVFEPADLCADEVTSVAHTF